MELVKTNDTLAKGLSQLLASEGGFSFTPSIQPYSPQQTGTILKLLRRIIGREVSTTLQEATLFRGNTIYTTIISSYVRLVCKGMLPSSISNSLDYLYNTLSQCFKLFNDSNKDIEVDPKKIDDPLKLPDNTQNLMDTLDLVLLTIFNSKEAVPLYAPRVYLLLLL